LLKPLPGPVSRKEEAAALQLETVDRFLPKLGFVGAFHLVDARSPLRAELRTTAVENDFRSTSCLANPELDRRLVEKPASQVAFA